MKKIIAIILIFLAAMCLVAADYNINVSKSISATHVVIKPAQVDCNKREIVVPYCYAEPNGEEHNCTTVTIAGSAFDLTDGTGKICSSIKAAVKAKEKI